MEDTRAHTRLPSILVEVFVVCRNTHPTLVFYPDVNRLVIGLDCQRDAACSNAPRFITRENPIVVFSVRNVVLGCNNGRLLGPMTWTPSQHSADCGEYTFEGGMTQLKTECSDLLNNLIQSQNRLIQYTDHIF
ncbi:hypothetical protein J6590_060132, partial [Homalodisca vitripennis]